MGSCHPGLRRHFVLISSPAQYFSHGLGRVQYCTVAMRGCLSSKPHLLAADLVLFFAPSFHHLRAVSRVVSQVGAHTCSMNSRQVTPFPSQLFPARGQSLSDNAIHQNVYPLQYGLLVLMNARSFEVLIFKLGVPCSHLPMYPYASPPFNRHITRAQAYDLPLEVGLVSFGSEVNVDCAITPLLEKFRDKVKA